MDGSQKIIDLLQNVLLDAINVSVLANEYIPVIDILLKMYIEKSNSKIQSMIEDSHIFARYKTLEGKYAFHYKSDPLYSSMVYI